MKITNTKISTQLKLSIGAVLLFVAVLAALAWFQTDRLWRQTQVLYDHPLEVRRAIGNLKTDILIIHWSMEELFARYSVENMAQTLPLIKAREESAQKQLDILFERYSGSRAHLEALNQAVNQCRINREQVISLMRSGDIEKAQTINIHNEVGPDTTHLQQVMGLLQTVDDSSLNFAERYYNNASEHYSAMVQQMIFVVFAIIFLATGVGYALYKRINPPLKELNSLTDKFRKGDFNVRSQNVSRNEIGLLAESFNQLADAVSFQMEMRDINEQISETLLDANDIDVFRKNLLQQLVELTDSQMGAYFRLNTEENLFKPLTSTGLEHDQLKPFDASFLEGQLGKVLLTKKMTILKNIPEDSVFHFKTFAGTLLPREMISFPVVLDNVVRGIVVMARIKPYTQKAIEIMHQPWSTLVHTVFANLTAIEQTQKLSEELLENNQELQIQQGELQAQGRELLKQTEELQAQNTELDQQRQAVEEATRLKSQFLSNMSHELRTPLNSVMALSRVLIMQTGDKLTEEESGYLEIIQRNGKNLLTLINDILDLSKIEAGRMDLNPKTFSLSQTLESIVESIMPLAREKNIELHHDIKNDLPDIESDEIRVSQILQNLLGNAVKFTESGSVSVSAQADQDKIYVRVEDTGIGIEESDLPYIFDEFRQADGTSSRRHDGTGLGLTIAYKIAKMLGGDISVESTTGEGSTFILELPLVWKGRTVVYESTTAQASSEARTSQENTSEHSLEPRMSSINPAKKLKILMVEDNEAAIIQVMSVLESAGFAVDVAKGGQEAIDYVSHTIPDGIILDLMMPQVDGFEVLERIRSRPATADIPVLILTAKDLTPEDFQRLSANNIQQLIHKGDVDRESLLFKIRNMLQRG